MHSIAIKKLIILCKISVFQTALFFSQSMKEVEVAAFGNVRYDGIQNKTFDQFRESFSLAYPNLEEPFSKLRGSGFEVGIRSIVSVSFMQFTGISEGKFSNGNTLRIKNTITAPIVIGFPFIIGKLYVNPTLAFANTRLDVSTIYPNGIESYGKEGLFNGQFNTTGFYYGLDVAFTQRLGKNKKSRIEIGANYNFIASKKSYFTSSSYARNVSHGGYPLTLPTDVVEFNFGESFEYPNSGKGFITGQSSSLSFYINYAFILYKQN